MKDAPNRALLILALVLSGCATQPSTETSASALIGRFTNGDPFWPRWLELKRDGGFLYSQVTDVVNEKGQFEGSWSFTGTWTFHAPDRIELAPQSGARKVVLFVRRSGRGDYAILEPDLFPDILSTWAEDGGVRYLKKDRDQSRDRRRSQGDFHDEKRSAFSDE
jgi:hypothetical protein